MSELQNLEELIATLRAQHEKEPNERTKAALDEAQLAIDAYSADVSPTGNYEAEMQDRASAFLRGEIDPATKMAVDYPMALSAPRNDVQSTGKVESLERVTDPRVDWFDYEVTALAAFTPMVSDTLDVTFIREKLSEIDDASAVKAEEAAFAESSYETESFSGVLKKIGAYQTFTREQVEDANRNYANSYLRARMERDVWARVENQLVFGVGGANALLGITNSAANTKRTASAGNAITLANNANAATKLTAALKFFDAVGLASATMSLSGIESDAHTGCGHMASHIICHPLDAVKLSQVKDSDSRYLLGGNQPVSMQTLSAVMGVMVVTHEKVARNDFWVVARPVNEHWSLGQSSLRMETGLKNDDLIKNLMTTVAYTFAGQSFRRPNGIQLITFPAQNL